MYAKSPQNHKTSIFEAFTEVSGVSLTSPELEANDLPPARALDAPLSCAASWPFWPSWARAPP